MNILGEAYIFYADIYFVQNFLIKLIVLWLVMSVSKKFFQVSLYRLVAAAIIGTLFEIIGLLYIGNYMLFLLLAHLIEVPCMVLFLERKNKEQLIKNILWGYFFTMIINAVLEAFYNIFGQNGHYFILLILSCGVVVIGTTYFLHWKKQTKGVYDVELKQGDICVRRKAFYDSGNHLKDPYTQKGVHIISEKLMKELSITEEKKVYIPYHSLGNENGLMDVVYLDEILIYGSKETVKQQKIPVGITKEDMFFDKSYEMILNEEVF